MYRSKFLLRSTFIRRRAIKLVNYIIFAIASLVSVNCFATCPATGLPLTQGATRGLALSDNRNINDDSSYTYDYTGTYTYGQNQTGFVHVYVLDSGIDKNNPEYEQRVSSLGADFTGTDAFVDTHPKFHGDNMASAIGGKTFGVAKCVILHSVKVTIDGSVNAVIAKQAVDWVISNGQIPGVINLSIDPAGTTAEKIALNNSIRNAVAQGYFVVKSAGNDGGNACLNNVIATIPEVFVVGSFDYSYSSYGTCLDLFASGEGVFGVKPGGGFQGNEGTSGSAALTSGAAALVLAQWHSATPNQVAWELIARSTPNLLNPSLFPYSPNRVLYTRPIGYTVPPNAPAAVDMYDHCGSSYTIQITRGTTTTANWPTYFQVQSSPTSSFTTTTTTYGDAKDAVDYAGFIGLSGTNYFRARACNMYGCSAYQTAPLTSPGC